MTALTRRQSREVDRIAIEEFGVPSVVLMENAGRGAAEAILRLITDEIRSPWTEVRVAVMCGGGNNGGDGYVVARHLHNVGVTVTIFPAVAVNKLRGDALINATICQRLGLPFLPMTDAAELGGASPRWRDAHVLVDALLGTGFSGEMRPHVAAVIERCNDAKRGGARIVAMDLPSGLDCDTGQPSRATIRADITTTFAGEKIGFAAPSAREFLGRVVCVPIGIPPEIIARAIAPA